MISITPQSAICNTHEQAILTPEFYSRRNRAYSEIYQHIAAGNEKGVSALFLAYQDCLSVGDAYDLMQTALCTIAAKKAREAGAWI